MMVLQNTHFGIGVMTVVLSALTAFVSPGTVLGQCAANEFNKLLASDASAGDRFGRAVSVSGDVAVIGAHNVGSSEWWFFNGPGAAYVLRRVGGEWVEEAVLTASDAALNDWFGYSVSVSGDVAVIGARYDDENGSSSGSAYVFRYDGADWIEEAKLTASDGAGQDWFGSSVSISGNIAVVGAIQNSVTAPGKAYVYRFDGAQWVEEAILLSSDSGERDNFGISVSNTGDVIVVGAWNHDNSGDPTFRDGTGAAYVFRHAGANWVEEAKLVSTFPTPGVWDRFGVSVSLGADGNVVVVGIDPGSVSVFLPGSAYIFRFNGEDWVHEAQLMSSDGHGGDRFGTSVSISGDVIVAGAWGEWSTGDVCPPFTTCHSGSAYAFLLDETGWVEQAKLNSSDIADGDTFGWSVAVSGGTAVIGAWRDDDAGEDSGSAYFFHGLSDCNNNGALDACDIANETSLDVNSNGIPDECEAVIPTVSEWGMIVMTLSLLTVGTLVLKRRRGFVCQLTE